MPAKNEVIEPSDFPCPACMEAWPVNLEKPKIYARTTNAQLEKTRSLPLVEMTSGLGDSPPKERQYRYHSEQT
nr:hypothetical protein [uncultured Desulfobulbus sp.]